MSKIEPQTSLSNCLFTLQSWEAKKGVKCLLATICGIHWKDLKKLQISSYLCPSLAHKLDMKKVQKGNVLKDLLQQLRCQQWHRALRDLHHGTHLKNNWTLFEELMFRLAPTASPPPLQRFCLKQPTCLCNQYNEYLQGRFSFEIKFSLYHNHLITV